jgi:hypothetical protein
MTRLGAVALLLLFMLSWGYPEITSRAAVGLDRSGAGTLAPDDARAQERIAAAVSCNAYEPNDTKSTMYGPVAPGIELRAKLCTASDLDYYYFRALKSRALVINLTLPPALVRHVSIWVYSGKGVPLFGKDRITGAATTLRYSLPRDGKYIVGLYSPDQRFESGAAYSLKLGFREQILPTATPTLTQAPSPTPTLTPTRTATPTRTPVPTYLLTIKGVYSGGSNGTFEVTHGVPYPISGSESHPCGQDGFDRWQVTSGSASIASPTSPSTTVTLYSGDATVAAVYCGYVPS